MNEPFDAPEIPIQPGHKIPLQNPRLQRRVRRWLGRLLVCNPFYLLSVALLLFGCYRISLEPALFNHEAAHLFFNFTSLQVYELLLVLTAVFLAARRIWYDSTLLVGIENLLIFVPFILISQAALINSAITWQLAVASGLIALGRAAALKHWIRHLDIPRGLAAAGVFVLIVNAALPVVYRILHESKFGTHPDWGAAFYTNEWTWWGILPSVCVAALLTAPLRSRDNLWPGHRWLLPGLALLWVGGTTVHLYCLGYVYDFLLRGDLVAPALCTLAWILCKAVSEVRPSLSAWARAVLLVLPLAVSYLAFAQPGHKVFFVLALLNLVIYRGLLLRRAADIVTFQLFLLAATALVSGFPEDWGQPYVQEFSRAKCVGVAIAGYVLLQSAFSSSPKAGLFGALVCSTTIVAFLGSEATAVHWALQAGTVFLLLHSLRWAEPAYPGAPLLRIITAAAWIVDSFVWLRAGSPPGMPWLGAAIVLAVAVIFHYQTKSWASRLVSIAAIVVMLLGPANATGGKLQSIPTGVLAVLGSFFLFAMGTLAALWRARWHGP